MTTRQIICAISALAIIASVIMVFEGYKILSAKLVLAGFIVMVISIVICLFTSPLNQDSSFFGGGDDFVGGGGGFDGGGDGGGCCS